MVVALAVEPGTINTPPAPIALKRKRRLVDESEDDESGLVRKLEFEEKDDESGLVRKLEFEEKEVEGIAGRTRSRRNEYVVGVNDEDLKKETPEKDPPMGSPTTPPAPIALKRKRRLDDESDCGTYGNLRRCCITRYFACSF